MFSPQRPDKEQVLRLREEFGVYAVASGRVNVAGMTLTTWRHCAKRLSPYCKMRHKKACVMQAFFISDYQTGISS